jgi:hypothetical protein
MFYAQTEPESLRTLRSVLSKLQNEGNSKKKTLDHFENTLKILELRLQELERDHHVLLRRYAELIKQKAIQAPPDQPPLQTVPWDVGNPTTAVPSKGELTKRTETSVATIQKKGK